MTHPSEPTGAAPPDVGALLEELRAQVRARRLALGLAEPDPIERDLRRSLDDIELYRVVSAHWPLLGKTLPQRAVALLNKLVRRYLRWYINPIVEQQNAYNDAVARALRLLADAYADLGEQLAQATPRPAQADGQAADEPPIGTPPAPSGDGLREAISQRAAAEPPARFADLELAALRPQLQLRQQVSAHWPLGGATLPQRVVALLNRAVRQYLRWYINPIVEQQNAANAALAAALLQLMRLDAARRAEIAALRARAKGRAA